MKKLVLAAAVFLAASALSFSRQYVTLIVHGGSTPQKTVAAIAALTDDGYEIVSYAQYGLDMLLIYKDPDGQPEKGYSDKVPEPKSKK